VDVLGVGEVPSSLPEEGKNMVAIVAGNSLGLSLTSLSTLGSDGKTGSSPVARNAEQIFVNAENGNLVVQDQDEYVAARGLDLNGLRTYNSQGKILGGTAEGWGVGAARQKVVLTGAWGNATSTIVRTDIDGASATYTWDAPNLRYLTTEGGGAYDAITKDAQGNFQWKDGTTQVIETYDAANGGRILRAADPDNNTVTFNYDGLGRLSYATGANGERLTYVYDPATGRLSDLTTTGAGGANVKRIHYDWDASGRMKSVTVDLTPDNTSDSSTYTTSYAYDSNNRITSITQRAGGASNDNFACTITYDAQGRVQSLRDGIGNNTGFDYSVASQTTVTDPTGVKTVLQYDSGGRLASISIAGQLEHSFQYNFTGDVTKVTDGSGNAVTYGVDQNGNVTSQADALGDTSSRVFDATNNTLQSESVFNVPAQGTTPASGEAKTQYSYFSQYPTRLHYVVTAQGRVTEYGYDSFGQRTSVIRYDVLYTGTASESAITTWANARAVNEISRTDYGYTPQGEMDHATDYAAVLSTHAGDQTAANTTTS
jgi:YD repeat-containing protein